MSEKGRRSSLMKISSVEATEREIQRNNLVSVFRLAIKSLIDLFFVNRLTEHSSEFLNFVAIAENILYFAFHHSKGTPWGFVKLCCKQAGHSASLDTIKRFDNVATDHGRLRMWIRMCVMEKRFSDYFKLLYEDEKRLSRFYSDHSVFHLKHAIDVVYNDLIGLNAVDLLFCLRGSTTDFDHEVRAIDYTPYLNFQQCPESAILDLVHAEREATAKKKDTVDHAQQCAYLEELVKTRDQQIEQLKQTEVELTAKLAEYRSTIKSERQSYESVILELQRNNNNPSNGLRVSHSTGHMSQSMPHTGALDDVCLTSMDLDDRKEDLVMQEEPKVDFN